MNERGHSDETSDGNEEGPGNWSILVTLWQRSRQNCVMPQDSGELGVMMAHASREALKILCGFFSPHTVKCEKKLF